MSYKNVRLSRSVVQAYDLNENKRVILGAAIDDSDGSIRVSESLPTGHPIEHDRAWLWRSEWEEISPGAVFSESEILYNTYRPVASNVSVVPDGEPKLAPVDDIDATKYVIEVRVDNVTDLGTVLHLLDEGGLAFTERTTVTTV